MYRAEEARAASITVLFKMLLVFVNSSRGKPLLQVEGYMYRIDSVSEERANWRCLEKGCKARISTENGEHKVRNSSSFLIVSRYEFPWTIAISHQFAS